ncbi:MAG: recombination mediator RecR [Bacteroidota bacterium]|nr:recombination mediator RecR [Bacteroidota bacterium]
MEYSSKLIENAVEQMAKLPGIGRKTALRLVMQIIRWEAADIKALAESLRVLPEQLIKCKQCNNVSDTELCHICSDKSRIDELICVVEDMRDVISIENTNQFKGRYNVLGTLISPIQGIGPDHLFIDQLLETVSTWTEGEVILALNSNMDGDTTAFYLSKKLAVYPVNITTLSKGIAVGGELEYADEITLGRSIIGRVPYKLG